MFAAYHYGKNLLTGPRKDAFDAGKTLSDIVAMANRAVWIFGFSLLAQSAEIGLIGVREMRWWESAAFSIVWYLCGVILPTLLGAQIFLIAMADLRAWKTKWYWMGLAQLAVLVVGLVAFSTVAIVATTIREEFDYSRAKAKDNDQTVLWNLLTERQNQQTKELLRELKPDALK